jgi:Glycosyl transferase family 2
LSASTGKLSKALQLPRIGGRSWCNTRGSGDRTCRACPLAVAGGETSVPHRAGERILAASLSLLLPVCNAQRGLETQVERVLDLLPELSDRFDVVIIDDGSTDETHEVAADLARRYPQVGVVRHSVQRGVEEAIKTGLGSSTADVVMVHASDAPLDSATLANLWSNSSGGSNDLRARPLSTERTKATEEPRRRRRASTARD